MSGGKQILNNRGVDEEHLHTESLNNALSESLSVELPHILLLSLCAELDNKGYQPNHYHVCDQQDNWHSKCEDQPEEE